MKRSAVGLAVLLGTLAAGGCDVFEPTPARVGTFVLVTVAGEPLPAVLLDNGSVVITVLADTIVLFDDLTAERRITVRYGVPGGTSPGEIDRSREELDYTTAGGEIHLNYRCNDTASCIGPPHLVGRYIEGGLQLDYALNYRVPLVYEQID